MGTFDALVAERRLDNTYRAPSQVDSLGDCPQTARLGAMPPLVDVDRQQEVVTMFESSSNGFPYGGWGAALFDFFFGA